MLYVVRNGYRVVDPAGYLLGRSGDVVELDPEDLPGQAHRLRPATKEEIASASSSRSPARGGYVTRPLTPDADASGATDPE